ncbi:MAG: hypothetical protein ACR2KS_11000 [Candidatus Eremiobacter antarcticus]
MMKIGSKMPLSARVFCTMLFALAFVTLEWSPTGAAVVRALGVSVAAMAPMAGSQAGKFQPDAAEAAFVRDVSERLGQKYPDTRSALAAGYYQTTKLEPDGTTIWFNNRWSGVSKYSPNFLWYDKHGRLAGLDYQYEVSAWPNPPAKNVYPVRRSRWTTIDPHIHFAYKTPSGIIKRRGARMLPNLQGRTVTAQQLRAAKLLPPNATLLWTYVHPKAWDLGFWVVPNPSGAFAELNPNVRP